MIFTLIFNEVAETSYMYNLYLNAYFLYIGFGNRFLDCLVIL